MPLTDSEIKNAKPLKAKSYKLADGGGLFALVNPNGAKYWRLKYRIAGREKLLALGVYPAVSLKAARERRETARDALIFAALACEFAPMDGEGLGAPDAARLHRVLYALIRCLEGVAGVTADEAGVAECLVGSRRLAWGAAVAEAERLTDGTPAAVSMAARGRTA